MEKSNKDISAMTDKGLLVIMGEFIKTTRLQQNKTQQEVADAAGINRTTLLQIEQGAGGTMQSFVQIMRALNELGLFTYFEITPQVSPLQLAKLSMQKRKRATGNTAEKSTPKSDW